MGSGITIRWLHILIMTMFDLLCWLQRCQYAVNDLQRSDIPAMKKQQAWVGVQA
jgi:hypothetical protein